MNFLHFFIALVIAIIVTVISTFIVSPSVSWVFLPYILGSWLVFSGYMRRNVIEVTRTVPTPAFMVGWGGFLIAIASSYLAQYYTGDFRVAISIFLIIILIIVLLINQLIHNINKK
ncbi:MAG: hypothetical protein QXV69_09170 [Sulfolobaceae archaeon]